MNTRAISILLTLTLTFFLFFYCEASASLELRGFEQDGNNYIITVYSPQVSPQVCTLEFLWKEQDASQGAYLLIGTLSSANYGNLYRMKWDVSQISDGNYTIMVQSSCGSQLEVNVEVNRAHWEISPVQLQYPGTTTARYLGSIDGTVDVVPTGGTLDPYSQYFIFTKEGDDIFRITCLEIPSSILTENIYLEMYSHGKHFGTLEYTINDDVLQVRVTFPGFADYSPGSSDTPEPPEPEPTQPTESQGELLAELKSINEQLQQVSNQNATLTQEITNLRNSLQQKDQRIQELENALLQKDKEKEQEVEEARNNLILYVLIALGIGAGIGYAVTRQNTTPSRPHQDSFMHGKPFRLQPSETEKADAIPMIVFQAAGEKDLDPMYLNKLVNDEISKKPHLTAQRALNLVLNRLKDEGEI